MFDLLLSRARGQAAAFGADARLAVRGFRRTPGFFLTAVVILGIGIGASVAMFAVFRTVLVKQLPVRDQDRIVVMWTYRTPGSDFAPAPQLLAPFRRTSRTLSEFAGVAHWGATTAPFTVGDRTFAMKQGMVTANFFDVLGARPVLGSFFHREDEEAAFAPLGKDDGRERKIVLGYEAWRKQMNGDSSVIGKRVVDPVTKWAYRIVGIAPPGLAYPAGVDFWLPMRGGWTASTSVFVVGRLAPGAALTDARAEYVAFTEHADPSFKITGAHAATFAETVIGNVRPVLGILTAAVALLLAIACLNVGNLLLLRASGRTREFAVRRALGAQFGDIAWQLFVESALLALAGGALGLLIATALTRNVGLIAPYNLPRLDEVQLANAPIVPAIGVTAIAVLLFGVLPTILMARGDAAAPLRLSGRTGLESRGRRLVRQTLVASQVALALVMLAGAALLARSLGRLQGDDVGFDRQHLMAVSFTPDWMRDTSAQMLTEVAQRMQRRLASIPGIIASTPLVVPPMVGTGVWQIRFSKPGQSNDEAAANATTPGDVVGPGYFRTFGIPILRGRGFTDADGASAPLVMIVNESFARLYWPNEDAMGKQLRVPMAASVDVVGGNGWRTVVGVAKDAHVRVLRETSPVAYLPVGQGFWQGYFAIRATESAAALTPMLRTALADVAPTTKLYDVRSMDDVLAPSLAEPRLGTTLMSSFGLVALLLAAIGLYGVMASLVRDQTREIGIRIALGATIGRVRREVLARAAIVMGAGAIAGLVAAVATSRMLSSLLFQVGPFDPLSLGGACALLLLVGGLAAYFPARRATRVDPVQALRSD
ncbi:MAG TPA: ADOP family duplicated permease [Gemmatimonadaceae bacterium]|nr:ADOP family duplicated permease [Gemmatimonadaceae bacterium]